MNLPKHLSSALHKGGPRGRASGAGPGSDGEQRRGLQLHNVHGALALVTGVLVANGSHVMQQLQQLQRPRGAGGSGRGRKFSPPWKAFFRDLRQQQQHKLPRNLANFAARAEEKQRELDPQGAIPLLEEALKREPNNVHLLVLMAKQWSDSSFLPHWPESERLPANEKALEYSKQAVAADPNDSMGYVVCCMSHGRLAYWSKDAKQKVHYAAKAQDEVATALKLNPNNDLAHHLMGRWHYEMAQLNFVVRSLVRVLYGASLMAGSVPDALASYQRAVALAPRRMVHHVELGRVLQRMGDHEGALRALRTAVDLDIEDINSDINRTEALLMISALEKRLKRSAFKLPSVAIALPAVPVEA